MYTYALIKTPQDSLRLPPGLMGDLELVCQQGIAAIAEPGLSPSRIETVVKDDELLQRAYVHYGVVICELFRQTTLLPLKFYHCFSDRPALEHHLLTYQQNYLQQLNHLEGKGEYVLKLTPQLQNLSPLNQENKGKAYFLAKKQRYEQQQVYLEQQQAQEAEILAEILHLYPEAIAPKPQDSERKIFLLVAQDDQPLLYQRVRDWGDRYSHGQLTLSDAIPPYDFL